MRTGTKTEKGRRLTGQGEPLLYTLVLMVSKTFILRSQQIKLVFWLSECCLELVTLHEAKKPVLRQSVPFWLDTTPSFVAFPLFNWACITHPFLPHSPMKRHAIGIKGWNSSWARWLHFCKKKKFMRATEAAKENSTCWQDELLFEWHPVVGIWSSLTGWTDYVTLRTAMAQMQLVTQSTAHSYQHTELWLHNYVTCTSWSFPPKPFEPENNSLWMHFALEMSPESTEVDLEG